MRNFLRILAVLAIVAGLGRYGCKNWRNQNPIAKQDDENSKRADEAASRGLKAFHKKDFDKAFEGFSEAIRLDPKNGLAHFGRGMVYLSKKEHNKAISDFNEVMRLTPKITADPRVNIFYSLRGQAFQGNKEYHLAIADYDQAIRLQPKTPTAYNQLAWLLATCPKGELRDGKRAVALATKACELSKWKDGTTIDTLAAANAECGNLKEAVKWQQKAIEMGYGDKEEEKKGRERLKLYEEGKAYREE
jgi:tetratricopeptide (TPR) repeat protein